MLHNSKQESQDPSLRGFEDILTPTFTDNTSEITLCDTDNVGVNLDGIEDVEE